MRMTSKPRNAGKTYSEEELEEAAQLSATHTLEAIAKRLGRPVQGLRVKLIEAGTLSMHEESGTYSAKALGEIIGVSHETVRRWINKNELPASKKSRRQGTERRNMHYHISPDDFWSWASDNRDLIAFNKLERNALPPEPAWVAEERRRQYGQPPKQKMWTVEEDRRLLNYYHGQGLRQREIAALLNRTEPSVEKRLKRLRQN